ncbi:hypothetical protein CEXT_523451 [Caerostris extrusa]|uniref:Uncharacterized protein n=1 Tax=Caerostris extrusa TaxID=172846 RepID=A0AAV4N697_CAEEX|nr:hypothetical protein CEXT_523451 [Caerostris extrusa]
MDIADINLDIADINLDIADTNMEKRKAPDKTNTPNARKGRGLSWYRARIQVFGRVLASTLVPTCPDFGIADRRNSGRSLAPFRFRSWYANQAECCKLSCSNSCGGMECFIESMGYRKI